MARTTVNSRYSPPIGCVQNRPCASLSESEMFVFQQLAERQLQRAFSDSQILNLQTRVRFPVALPNLNVSAINHLTPSSESQNFCSVLGFVLAARSISFVDRIPDLFQTGMLVKPRHIHFAVAQCIHHGCQVAWGHTPKARFRLSFRLPIALICGERILRATPKECRLLQPSRSIE